MTSYLDLPIGDGTPELITAVIEIPQGGINNYEYDKKLHVFRLDRNLHIQAAHNRYREKHAAA